MAQTQCILQKFAQSRPQTKVHPIEFLDPKLQTVPDRSILLQISDNQLLTRLEDFEIFNNFGRITFLTPVDLTHMNLNEIQLTYGDFKLCQGYFRFRVQLYGIIAPSIDVLNEQARSRGLVVTHYSPGEKILVMEG